MASRHRGEVIDGVLAIILGFIFRVQAPRLNSRVGGVQGRFACSRLGGPLDSKNGRNFGLGANAKR